MPGRGSPLVVFRLPASELSKLDALARKLHLTRSGVIRHALDSLSARAYDTTSATARTGSAPTPAGEVERRPPPPLTPSPATSHDELDDIDQFLADLEKS